MLFQDDCLWPGLTIGYQIDLAENSRLNSPNKHLYDNKSFKKVIIDSLGIAPLLSRTPESLSGGEARRCQLARVLVNAPEIVLLDEPLAFLDDGTAKSVASFLGELLPQLSSICIIVSHELDFFGGQGWPKHHFNDLLRP